MSGSLTGVDRKQMEAERLARLARKRGADAPVQDTRDAKVPRVEEKPDTAPSPRKATLASRGPTESTETNSTTTRDDVEIQAKTCLRFPTGVIKRTWAFGFERDNDIKIEQVLEKSDLNIALLSSFQWDMEWLSRKLDIAKTKLILVMGEREFNRQEQWRREAKQWSNSIRLCFPALTGPYSCMHSKLMVLFFPHHLRIAVPSANLVSYDWGESGIMENSVFLIDLPRLPEPQQGDANSTMTSFADELLQFLDAMQVSEDVKQGVRKFDFSATARIAFVHSIGGSFLGPAALKTGFPLLSQSVRELNLATAAAAPLEVDFAASSVGSLDGKQVKTLCRALRGLEPMEPSAPAKGKTKPAGEPDGNPLDQFRIVFPTQDTVKRSRGGPENGGTIFLREEAFTKPDFPRSAMRDFTSTRPGLLSHNKMILARSARKAFVYTGSANLSQSAWGRMTYDRGSKGRKLFVSNWECGVLVPVPVPASVPAEARSESGGMDAAALGTRDAPEIIRDEDDISTEDEDEREDERGREGGGEGEGEGGGEGEASTYGSRGAQDVVPYSVFDGTVDIPFALPGRPYAAGQKPWSAQ